MHPRLASAKATGKFSLKNYSEDLQIATWLSQVLTCVQEFAAARRAPPHVVLDIRKDSPKLCQPVITAFR
jgi:hypothetical protein